MPTGFRALRPAELSGRICAALVQRHQTATNGDKLAAEYFELFRELGDSMTNEKARRGRPSSYRPAFAKQAAKVCRLGATDIELADFFDVAPSTITKWKTTHKEFSASLKAAKAPADDRVERSLYARAIGYTHDAEEIFCKDGKVTRVPVRKHVPPDTTACIFWLKNRRKTEWRDKHEIDHNTSDVPPADPTQTAEELRAEIIHDMVRVGFMPPDVLDFLPEEYRQKQLPAPEPTSVANGPSGRNGTGTAHRF
jgi:hypothetical protein